METEVQLIIMNFSGVYEAEAFYKDYEYVWVDCSDIQGTNCYCDAQAEVQIKERLRGLAGTAGTTGIHFLDSGNYHYASKIWLDGLEEDAELLVFDHHTDMQPPMFGDILSCGSWIKAVLDTNPRIKRVWLAGPPEEAYNEIREDGYGGRVVWIGEEDMKDTFALRERLGSSALPLYISVDEDVLGPEDARTNWDQGSADIRTVLECIRTAADCRRIIGMDVCGGNPEGMEDGTAARDRDDAARDIGINDRTNGALVRCFKALPR